MPLPIPLHSEGCWFHTDHIRSLPLDYLLVSSNFKYIGMDGLLCFESDTETFYFIVLSNLVNTISCPLSLHILSHVTPYLWLTTRFDLDFFSSFETLKFQKLTHLSFVILNKKSHILRKDNDFDKGLISWIYEELL